MSRRMEIELTSDRGDGSWTWRAAGAKQPRGVVDAALVPEGASVGDVLRAEVEVELEGITVLSLGATQTRARNEPQRIELVGSGGRDDEQLVTTRLVSKGRGDRDRRDRRGRGPGGGDRDDRRDRREGAPRGRRPGGERGERSERRPRHPAPPPLPERPKPKRLRAGRTHRKAVLSELPAEQQPIAEEVLRGGIPAVRQAIDAENEKRKAAGEPTIDGKELLRLAEQLLPRLRSAEWRDRADAALADADQLDLRDLRSVVVAADAAARDEESREIARQLREKLDERLVTEQARWLEDLQFAVDAGRIVRALRDSSRPPKAGTMLPPELRLALLGGANAALTAEASVERWSAVLDALAHSPVRAEVAPVSTPEAPSEELLAVVKRYASRVPKVAIAFGIQPSESGGRGRRRGKGLRPAEPGRRDGAVPVPERPEATGLAAPVPADTSADVPAEATAEEAEPAAVDEAPEPTVADPPPEPAAVDPTPEADDEPTGPPASEGDQAEGDQPEG